jgi:hypothetical protein
MLDVPADRGAGFGVFDNGGPNGDASALAKAIKLAATSAYGTAGPEFVRRLIADSVTGDENNVPAVYTVSEFVRDGGLLSYGLDLVDSYRRAATYVDRILRGAKPGDLPVQFPTKSEMAVNLKTAKALGLTVPQSILLRACPRSTHPVSTPWRAV